MAQLEMQLCLGGVAAAAGKGNGIALVHGVPKRNLDFAKICIAREEAAFVRNFNHQSVSAALHYANHRASLGGVNLVPLGRGKVQPKVHYTL